MKTKGNYGIDSPNACHRAARHPVRGPHRQQAAWNRHAVSDNRAGSVLENAAIEGVRDRVAVKEGDARKLPFADSTFDVVVSNFVVHELKSRADRQQLMCEVARLLKPGGRVALADFIFTDECVDDLRKFAVETERTRDGFFSFWVSAILNLGAVRTYHVVGRKELASHPVQ